MGGVVRGDRAEEQSHGEDKWVRGEYEETMKLTAPFANLRNYLRNEKRGDIL